MTDDRNATVDVPTLHSISPAGGDAAMKCAYVAEPPFTYRSDDGTVTGCDVELARTVLSMFGIQDVELIETEFAQLIPGILEGRWRMTTGLFVTEERQKIIAFSQPIWALPDGLLVRSGNPKHLTGYSSVAQTPECTLAVIRDQIQHQSALDLGTPEDRILICDTYAEAAHAVLIGHADAYASVARAHKGFLKQHADLELEVVTVPPKEKAAGFGAFAFSKSDDEFRSAVDEALARYLGSDHHRVMMGRFGFTDAELTLLAVDTA